MAIPGPGTDVNQTVSEIPTEAVHCLRGKIWREQSSDPAMSQRMFNNRVAYVLAK